MRYLCIIMTILLCLGQTGCFNQSIKTPQNNAVRIAFFKAGQIKYKREFNTDHWQTPIETVIKGTGDCEDQSIYLQKLLRDKGWESQVIFGKTYLDMKKYNKLLADIVKGKKLLNDKPRYNRLLRNLAIYKKRISDLTKYKRIFKNIIKYQQLLNEKNRYKKVAKNTKQAIKESYTMLSSMHAWVEIPLKWMGTSMILDPTNNIYIYRTALKKNHYVHILGIIGLIEKAEKYQDKNNVILNYRYNILIHESKRLKEKIIIKDF